MSAFLRLPDLARARLGGRVLVANDEFFAPKENLVADTEPVFEPERYTERGKWMDGWETRRRREPGNDWCVVRLGVPGIVRGVVVDTSHFRGNHPESASVEGAHLGSEPARWDDVAWSELVPRSALQGDERNAFAVSDDRVWTHARLSIHPDGGVARLRVYGEASPDWDRLARAEPGARLEVAAIPRGGRVLACSDAFFGSPGNLLQPDEPRGMWDGWETRRRRGPGFDWVVVRLGRRVQVERVEIDTRHFKGNHPASARVEALDAPDADDRDVSAASGWREILDLRPLRPDVAHVFGAPDLRPAEASHVRLSILPDGGVARLRVRGAPV